MLGSVKVTILKPSQISLLQGNRQGRDEQKFQELKESMRSHGLINPVLVRQDAGAKDRYLCIAGEQRITAARDLKWEGIACRIIDDPGDAVSRDLQLIE